MKMPKRSGFCLPALVVAFTSGFFVTQAQTVYTVTAIPTLATAVPFQGASFDFTNPSDVDSNGRDYTSATALATLLNGESDYLEVKGFNFNLPPNAVIQGIQAEIERDATGLNLLTSVTDDQVYLMNNGIVSGTNQASSNQWTSALTWQGYGSAGSLWGSTWTPAQINSSNFGLALSVDIAGVASLIPTAKIYNVQLTVSYTTSSTVLPVTLSHFALESVDAGVKIEWLADDVDPGTGYWLERSADNNNWNGIDSNVYAGEHADELTYAYTDQSPLPGRSFYRLRMTGDDGTKTVSDILVYDNDNSSSSVGGTLMAFPNPAADRVTLSGMQAQSVSVFNSFGMAVRCPATTVATGVQLDLESIPPGIYFAKSGSKSIKFVHL